MFARKGMRGVAHDDDNGMEFDAAALPISDLAMLLSVPTFISRAVAWLKEPRLLETAPIQVLDGVRTFSFTHSFEVCGHASGAVGQNLAGLWRRHALKKCTQCRVMCCEARGGETQTDAVVVNVKGLADAVDGRTVLRRLASGGQMTLNAFDSEAVQALVSFKWRTFGVYGYSLRLAVYLVYLGIHTWVCRNRYNTTFGTEASSEKLAIRIACVITIGAACLWLADEVVQFVVPLVDASASERRLLSILERKQQKREPGIAGLAWWLRSQTRYIGGPLREYCLDVFNWIDVSSCIVTIAAMAYATVERDDAALTTGVATGPALLSVASLLCWARLFDMIRAIPGIGAYPYLLEEVFSDLRGFMCILLAMLVAFTVSLQTIAKPTFEDQGLGSNDDAQPDDTEDHPFSYFPSALYR